MRALAALLGFAALAAAQTPTHISPTDAALSMGNINNIAPFGLAMSHYQQIHDASSITNGNVTTPINRMRLRKVNGSTTYLGNTIDAELYMGEAAVPALLVSSTFASNVVTATERLVFTRKSVKLPDLNDTSWSAVDLKLDTPYPKIADRSIAWRIVVYGNNQQSNYTLDCWSDWRFGTASGAGCQHPNGTKAANHNSTYRSPGNITDFNGYCWVSSPIPAMLTFGLSITQWGPFTLPLDLTPFGAPGCGIFNDWVITGPAGISQYASGFVQVKIPLPNDLKLVGATFYSQFVFFDAQANALGLITTNTQVNGPVPKHNGIARVYDGSNPYATVGTTVGPEYALATAWN